MLETNLYPPDMPPNHDLRVGAPAPQEVVAAARSV